MSGIQPQYRVRKAYTLHDFAYRCGYFWNGSPVNNGYGCMHPEQEQTEDSLGMCYAFRARSLMSRMRTLATI